MSGVKVLKFENIFHFQEWVNAVKETLISKHLDLIEEYIKKNKDEPFGNIYTKVDETEISFDAEKITALFKGVETHHRGNWSVFGDVKLIMKFDEMKWEVDEGRLQD